MGNAGFSESGIDYPEIAFSPSGQPYVVFMDFNISDKASVMKFDGNNWIYEGSAGFSSHMAFCTTIVFSPSGHPYVGFMDFENSMKATVMKYDGSNWVNVGLPGFSVGRADFPSLAFRQTGEPFIAFMDNDNSMKATVMYYNAPVGIDEPGQPEMLIYPNPVIDELTVEITRASKVNQLVIASIEGKDLMRQTITEPNATIDFRVFPSGVYLIKVTGEAGVQLCRVIKLCK